MEEILEIFREDPSRKTKNVMHAFYYVFTLCISYFNFGYTLIYISAVDFNVIVDVFKIDFEPSVAQGFLQGITPIGGAIGAATSSYFIAKFSRKNLLLLLNGAAIILYISSIINDYHVLFVVKFLQGIIAGIFTATIPMLVREVSPHQISSISGSFANVFGILGLFFLYLFSYLLGTVTGDYSGLTTWRIIFLFPILSICLQTIVIIKVYPFETPKYLAHNNMTAELKQLMGEFYKIEYVDQMYKHFMKHHGPQVSFEEEEHRSDSNGQLIKDAKVSKSALFYGVFYAFLCPMAGINIVMSYGGDVVSQIAPSLKLVMPTLLMLFYLFTAIISVIPIKKYGRKTLTMYGTIGILINLYIISYAYFIAQSNPSLSQILVVAALFMFLLAFGLTFAPVMWMWVSQALLPHTIGYAVMANWIGASLVMILFPILLVYLPNNNPAYIFLFFAIYQTISLYVTNKFMLQTKDKYEHQIAKQYRELDAQIFGVQQNPENIELLLVDQKK